MYVYLPEGDGLHLEHRVPFRLPAMGRELSVLRLSVSFGTLAFLTISAPTVGSSPTGASSPLPPPSGSSGMSYRVPYIIGLVSAAPLYICVVERRDARLQAGDTMVPHAYLLDR